MKTFLKTRQFSQIALPVLAVLALLGTSAAEARSVTAFGSFHVETIPNGQNPYLCLAENNGAVVNNCSYSVSLEFNLPIDNNGNHSVTIWDTLNGTAAEDTFTCDLYVPSLNPPASSTFAGVSFTGPDEHLSASLAANGGQSLHVICWNIPAGGGVLNFDYAP